MASRADETAVSEIAAKALRFMFAPGTANSWRLLWLNDSARPDGVACSLKGYRIDTLVLLGFPTARGPWSAS